MDSMKPDKELMDPTERIKSLNLEKILDEAPAEVTYRHNGDSGFYLENSVISIRYCRAFVKLGFININPRYFLFGYSNDLRNWTAGNFVAMRLDSEGQVASADDIFYIDSLPKFLSDYSAQLLRKASEKYHLKDWHKVWQGRLSPKRVGQPNILKRLAEWVKGYQSTRGYLPHTRRYLPGK